MFAVLLVSLAGTGLFLFCFDDSVCTICSKVCRHTGVLFCVCVMVFGLVMFNSLVEEASLLEESLLQLEERSLQFRAVGFCSFSPNVFDVPLS